MSQYPSTQSQQGNVGCQSGRQSCPTSHKKVNFSCRQGRRAHRRGIKRLNASRADQLKRENEKIRADIGRADSEMQALSQNYRKKNNGAGPTRFGAETETRSSAELKQKNAVAQKFAASGGSSAKPDNAEDYWSPQGRDQGVLDEHTGTISRIPDHDGTECLKWDDSLWSHADHFRYRWNLYKGIRQSIDQNEGGLDKFSQGYKIYGLNRGEHEGRTGIWYREWAPGARALALVGEFNNWQPKDHHWANKNEYGVWSLFLQDEPDGSSAIPHSLDLASIWVVKFVGFGPEGDFDSGTRYDGTARNYQYFGEVPTLNPVSEARKSMLGIRCNIQTGLQSANQYDPVSPLTSSLLPSHNHRLHSSTPCHSW